MPRHFLIDSVFFATIISTEFNIYANIIFFCVNIVNESYAEYVLLLKNHKTASSDCSLNAVVCILRRSVATGAVTSGHLAAQRPPVIRWSF